MPTSDVIDQAGTPLKDQVFAVFDSGSAAHAAAAKIGSRFGELRFLTGADDARSLHGKDEASGLLNQVIRTLKTFGGEENMAVRYGERLEAGGVIVVVPVVDRDAAKEVADQLGSLGAFDVAYFGKWTNEFFHPETASTRRPETTAGSQGDTTM